MFGYFGCLKQNVITRRQLTTQQNYFAYLLDSTILSNCLDQGANPVDVTLYRNTNTYL